MRDGITSAEIAAASAGLVTTAIAARLDFQSGVRFVWTGAMPIEPRLTGDGLLDGATFDPLSPGVVVEIGENSFSYSGSEELKISLAIPTAPDITLAAAQTYPDEYQSRQATIWRVLKVATPDPLAEPAWMFRRIRTGAMDKVEISNDGQSHNFNLTIESHQSSLSNATNSTWLDQPKFDPADTSQLYAVSIANGEPAPTNGTVAVNPFNTNGTWGLGNFFADKFNLRDD